MCDTVKSNDLKWLPNGSEFLLASEESKSEPSAKPRTYTSFTCSQETLPELSENPITAMSDILIAKLGYGQVKPATYPDFVFLYHSNA